MLELQIFGCIGVKTLFDLTLSMAEKNILLKKDARSKRKKQTDFIVKLSEFVSVSRACRLAKIPRATIFRWLNNDIAFKKQYANACEAALQRLEDEAVRRGFEGLLKPVYYQGKKIGTIREFSDTLLMALLKAKAPARYRDRAKAIDAVGVGEAVAPTYTVIKWGDKEISI